LPSTPPIETVEPTNMHEVEGKVRLLPSVQAVLERFNADASHAPIAV